MKEAMSDGTRKKLEKPEAIQKNSQRAFIAGCNCARSAVYASDLVDLPFKPDDKR